MVEKVKNLGDLVTDRTEFIDCYISTDTMEAKGVLGAVGFRPTYGQELSEFLEIYLVQDEEGSRIKHKRTGQVIDCVSVPLEEARRYEHGIGFIPMSKLRIYLNGSNDPEKVLLPILFSLDQEKQNLAFMNQSYSKTFVKKWTL